MQPRANKLPTCLCFLERRRRERESPEHQRAFANCTGNVMAQARQPTKTCTASLCTRNKSSHRTSKATENCFFSEPSAKVTKAWTSESSSRNLCFSVELASLIQFLLVLEDHGDFVVSPVTSQRENLASPMQIGHVVPCRPNTAKDHNKSLNIDRTSWRQRRIGIIKNNCGECMPSAQTTRN